MKKLVVAFLIFAVGYASGVFLYPITRDEYCQNRRKAAYEHCNELYDFEGMELDWLMCIGESEQIYMLCMAK